MKIELYEPELGARGGFFRYFFSALTQCKSARALTDPRPLPSVETPREHMSAWSRFDGHLVFFDMSDHIFLYDEEALKLCDVYFKTNLNQTVTDRILSVAGLEAHRSKIVPFFSFAQNLEMYRPGMLRNRIARILHRESYDVCHIVGVYENRVRDGERSIFEGGEDGANPSRYHFWIRYHCREAMRAAGISGYYRLISRGNQAIEDGELIKANLTQWEYIQKILAGRLTMINTLPHAIMPWKVTESLALGRPFITERAPLIEMPEPFELKPEEHYLELLPDHGDFDYQAPLKDPASYRVLQPIDPNVLTKRCEWLRETLADGTLIDHMAEQVRRYASRVLNKCFVADFICETVGRMVH